MSVYRMGRSWSEEQRRRLGFIRKMPCHATLTETIRAVDADALAASLGRVALKSNDATHRHIAIDGKTMLASKDGEGRAVHCVSAFCHALQQVVNHTASRGKGMEIPDAPKLLDRIDLKDKIAMGDTMFRQKTIAEKIVARGGDYVFPVKKTRKTFSMRFKRLSTSRFFPLANWHEPASKAQGRIEQPVIHVLPAEALSVDCRNAWGRIRQIGKVERTCSIQKKALGSGARNGLAHDQPFGTRSIARSLARL
jgi:predicted transposase YbfD/YdcC